MLKSKSILCEGLLGSSTVLNQDHRRRIEYLGVELKVRRHHRCQQL